MALLDMGIIYKKKTEEEKLKLHAAFVGLFLIVAHVAMIFGMLDPSLGTGASPHDMMHM
jgi:hypothetical protein